MAAFEDIRPTDVVARMDEIRTAYPVLSVNEIRARYYQLPAVEWGGLPVGSGDSINAHTTAAKSLPAELPESHIDTRDIDDFDANSDIPGDYLAELSRWEKFTIKRWGRVGGRPFEVRALPEAVAFSVSAGLLAATTPDEAKQVFASLREEVLAGETVTTD